MEQQDSRLNSLLTQAEQYGKTSLELAKLKTVQKLIPVATAFTGKLFVMSAFYLFIFLLNIGIAMWLGSLLGKPYMGFILIASFYLLTAIVIHYLSAKLFRKPISRFIIQQILNDNA
jgi:hypothetical protein